MKTKILLLFLVPLCASPAFAQAGQPGLAAHSYGNPSFVYYAGPLELKSLGETVEMGKLKWPAPNWDEAKGPIFHRDAGWSVVAYGRIQVARAGEYRFKQEGSAAELMIDDRLIPLDGKETVTLAAGSFPLTLYVKAPKPDEPLKLNVQWQEPGANGFAGIDAGLLTHDAADAQRTVAFNPRIPLVNPQIRFWHRRDYEVALPQDGFHEVAGHFDGVPSQIELTLDGKFLYHHLGRATFDPAGPSDYRFGFINTARAVRYLPKGKHVITVAGYWGTYPFDQKQVEAIFKIRFGISPIPARDPLRARSIYAKDREDLVFRKAEPLVIRIEQATQNPQDYTMEIVRQRGDGKAVWSGKVQLPSSTEHAVGDITYRCPTEGAFEYVIKDRSGRVVDGPWAFIVIDPAPQPVPKATIAEAEPRKILVDSVDCTKEDDPEHKFRDNGTSQVIPGVNGPYRVTGRSYKFTRQYKTKEPPPGLIRMKTDETGGNAHYDAMDWFAYTLKVRNPQKPHLVTAYVPNDVKRLVSVWGYDHVTGNYNMALLEAGDAPVSPAFSALSFIMWPNGQAIDVLTFCDSSDSGAETFWRQGAIAKIELYELPDGLPSLAAPSKGFMPAREFGWAGEQVNLGMEQRMMPRLWANDDLIPGVVDAFQWCEGGYHDWKALATVWERLGQLSQWRGDHLLIWPVNSYSMGRLAELNYMERDYESYTRSYRSRIVDPMRRDQFKMMLMLCEKHGVQLVADFQMSRWYDFVLQATDPEKKYPSDGIYLTDGQGQPVQYPAHILNPAHPLACQYLVAWVTEIAERYGRFPAFQGINIRQNGWHTNNSAYFYNRNWGYDDFTVGLFEKETGHAVPVRDAGPARFGLRRDYLLDKLKEPWLRWRCDKVYSLRQDMLAALRKHAPKARLYGSAVPGLIDFESGSGLDPKQLTGNRDLGYGKITQPTGPHVENGSLDPIEFVNFDVRESRSIRRTVDTAMGNRGYEYGLNPCAGAGASVRPHPYQLEPLARALAKGELQTVLYGGPWTLPAMDEGIRLWAQAWQAIPELKYNRVANSSQANQPVIAWLAKRGDDVVFYLVNVTPHEQKVRVQFEGTARGVQHLVSGQNLGQGGSVELAVVPFMVMPLSASGTVGIRQIEAIPDRELVASLERQVRFLETIAPRAQGITRVMPGMGDPFVKITVGQEQYDDGPWGRRDLKVTFDDLFQPILAAWKQKDYTTVDDKLQAMRQEHSWWYQAFGWPEGVYRAELPNKPYSNARELATALRSTGPISIDRHDGVAGDALVIPSGDATLSMKASSTGRWDLRLWMLSGKGYGPVEVSVDGGSVGEIGTANGKAAFAHFTLPRTLPLKAGPHRISLQSHGRELVLGAAEITLAPPEPIKRWSAIGLFDMGGTDVQWERGNFDTAFPPEKEFNPSATYDGLKGAKIRWQTIDIGEDKFIQLLEKYYPYDFVKGNGIAYLACWVKSPDEREATLYYAIDWFGRIWLNDEVVLKNGNGPWRSFAQTRVSLRAGWNQLLIKTACGRSSWKANFAFSDPGDLQFSPTLPGR